MKYHKQINVFVSITTKGKRRFYGNLVVKNITDSKKRPIKAYSKTPFLQQDKINKIHHSRRKWKNCKQ